VNFEPPFGDGGFFCIFMQLYADDLQMIAAYVTTASCISVKIIGGIK
jgi:hypothetical protein